MINLYFHIKLWYWWNYIVEQNKFHQYLDYGHIARHNRKLGFSRTDIGFIAVALRDIAHDLSNGRPILDIPLYKIKNARI